MVAPRYVNTYLFKKRLFLLVYLYDIIIYYYEIQLIKEKYMAGNASLTAAAADRNDEFYTQLTDIEKELKH